MVRVAALYRLSTKKMIERKSEDEVDLPGQRRAVAEFLLTKPEWSLVAEYEEKGVSAFKISAEDRDAVQEAFRDAANGQWTVLLIFRADRLSRKSLEYPQVLATLYSLGVEVWSVADAPGGKRLSLDNQTDKLMRFIEGWQAETESVNTRIRVSTRMKQIANDGRWCGGRVPFGYVLAPLLDSSGSVVLRGGKLVRVLAPHKENAPVIRQLFEMCANGAGTYRLVGWLNSSRISPMFAPIWSRNALRQVLKNPLYAGMVRYGRTVLRGDKRIKATVDHLILVKGAHEPLVSEDLWQRVQQVLALKKLVHPRQQSATYPLSGLLRCAVCGGKMGGDVWHWGTKTGRHSRYGYRCRKYDETNTCESTTHLAEAVEEAFITEVERLQYPTQLRVLLEQKHAAQHLRLRDAVAEKARAKERLTLIENALQRLDRSYFEVGNVSDEEYAAKKQAYQEEAGALCKVIKSPLPQEETFDMAQLADVAKEIRNLWRDSEATPEERKLFALHLTRTFGFVPYIDPTGSIVLKEKV